MAAQTSFADIAPSIEYDEKPPAKDTAASETEDGSDYRDSGSGKVAARPQRNGKVIKQIRVEKETSTLGRKLKSLCGGKVTFLSETRTRFRIDVPQGDGNDVALDFQLPEAFPFEAPLVRAIHGCDAITRYGLLDMSSKVVVIDCLQPTGWVPSNRIVHVVREILSTVNQAKAGTLQIKSLIGGRGGGGGGGGGGSFLEDASVLAASESKYGDSDRDPGYEKKAAVGSATAIAQAYGGDGEASRAPSKSDRILYAEDSVIDHRSIFGAVLFQCFHCIGLSYRLPRYLAVTPYSVLVLEPHMDMLNRVIVRNQWLLETVSVVNTVLADDAAGKGRIFKELQRAGIANSNSSWSTNDAGDGGEGEASSSLATNFYKVTDSLMGLSNRVVETADTVVHYAESALGLQGHLDIAPKQSFLELGVSGLQANNVFILDQAPKCAAVIRRNMHELGVKAPRATFALDDEAPGLADAVESGLSSFLGSFFQPSEEEKLKAKAREARKQPKPRIQRRAEIDRGGGGSWNEPRLVAVRRLEKELFESKNPTVSLVRAISDRYMQLIDAKISAGGGENDGDPSTRGISAQGLLAELRKFLDNDGVKKVLQEEEKAARARKESVGGADELSELNLDIQDGLVGIDSRQQGGVDSGVAKTNGGASAKVTVAKTNGREGDSKERASMSPVKISPGTGVPYKREINEMYSPSPKPIMQAITEVVSRVPQKQRLRMSTQVSVIRVAEQGMLRKGGKAAEVVVSPNKPPSRKMIQRTRKAAAAGKKNNLTSG